MGRDSNELVNVGAKVNLDHVSILEHDVGVVGQGREVANAVVDGDAARKSDS